LAQHETPAGELRLVAWTDEDIGGITIDPAASQSRHIGLMVAHLEYAATPPPAPDANSRAALEKESGKLPVPVEEPLN
jgi:hypothetical protein